MANILLRALGPHLAEPAGAAIKVMNFISRAFTGHDSNTVIRNYLYPVLIFERTQNAPSFLFFYRQQRANSREHVREMDQLALRFGGYKTFERLESKLFDG